MNKFADVTDVTGAILYLVDFGDGMKKFFPTDEVKRTKELLQLALRFMEANIVESWAHNHLYPFTDSE